MTISLRGQRGGRALKTYLISYLALLILPILVWLITLFQSTAIIGEQTDQLNKSMLRAIGETADYQAQAIMADALLLASDNQIRTLADLNALTRPAAVEACLAVMVLYYGIGHWNSWFNANIFLRTKALFPLQLIMRNMLINGTDLDVDSGTAGYEQIVETVKAAMVIITTLPILIIYPFLQKYFVSGIMIGSLKE